METRKYNKLINGDRKSALSYFERYITTKNINPPGL
jgi:hypothetical protein